MKPNLKPNWLEKTIGFFSPGSALQRFKERSMLALAESWSGASKSRTAGKTWKTSDGDADADTLSDLPELRRRSRDLVRNYALAAGAIHTKVTNIVGSGIRPQSKMDAKFLGLTPEAAEAWQQNTEREFSLWAESQACDMERSGTFYDLQELAFRSVLENGDVFVNLPFNTVAGQPYDLRIQLIEADRISNPNWRADGSEFNSNLLFGGVEKDQFGAPVAYHVSNVHPGALNNSRKLTWARMPAFGAKTGRRNVLHLYRKLRIGQSRGIPDLAAVIEPLKQLERYTEAEITAAVISGMFSVFVKTTDAEGLNLPVTEREASPYSPGYGPGGSPVAPADKRDVGMNPGAIIDLRPEEDVVFADPKRPSTAFDPFVMAILRQIGVALELPFEVLVKHFTASYSAARAALLEAWRFYLNRRAWLVSAFCQPVFEEWMAEAVAVGRINAPGFFDDPAIRKAYCRAVWIGPGRGQINPQAETDAAVARIEAGISTREKEAMEMDGSDWNLLHPQSVMEKKMRVEGGLELPVDAVLKAQSAQPQPKDKNSGDSTTHAND
jgi:lambda family phage portal protein